MKSIGEKDKPSRTLCLEADHKEQHQNSLNQWKRICYLPQSKHAPLEPIDRNEISNTNNTPTPKTHQPKTQKKKKKGRRKRKTLRLQFIQQQSHICDCPWDPQRK